MVAGVRMTTACREAYVDMSSTPMGGGICFRISSIGACATIEGASSLSPGRNTCSVNGCDCVPIFSLYRNKMANFGKLKGETLPNFGETIPVRLAPDMIRAIERWAHSRKLSRSNAVRILIEKGLSKYLLAIGGRCVWPTNQRGP